VTSDLDRIRSRARVLTTSGHGGTGKTRFSIELFRRLAPEYLEGAAFVSLAAVTSAADVLPVIGVSLDITEAQGRPAVDALCAVIGSRRTLLVLDNFEQVLDAAGDIAELVARCSGLEVVATSRAPLKTAAESEFVLPPLDLPDADASVDMMRTCASVVLFLQRAEKVKAGFALHAENAHAIASICRQLDGLPLALELAAARIRILEPAALLQRLDHAIDLLTSGDRDLPLRQRTLRATISWSYSLLDTSEQRLLRRTSVFHDGWTLEAMEQVCYTRDDRHRALDELDSLVEKGLVRVVDAAGRYSLLETIRAFSAEQLHASGEAEVLRHAHAQCFLAFAAGVDAGFRGRGQLRAVQGARVDNANLNAAIQWLTACARSGDAASLEHGLSMVGHLNWYWHSGGQHLTARDMVDALLGIGTHNVETRGRALALLSRCMIGTVANEWEQSLSSAASALVIGDAIGDEALGAEAAMFLGYGRLQAGSMTIKGMLLFATGNVDAGMSLVDEALVIQRRIEDNEMGGLALSFLAQMTFAKGEHARALALYRDALHALETVGDKLEIARVHGEMGWTALAAAAVTAARSVFQRAVRSYEDVGSVPGTGQALMGLAAVEAAAGNAERALQIAASAEAYSSRAGIVIDHPMGPGVLGRIEALKASIPRSTLAGIDAHAKLMTPDEVLATGELIPGSARAIYGQRVRIDQLGERARRALPPGVRDVVLVPWAYGPDCRPLPWSRSARWVTDTRSGVFAAQLRPREHWAGDVPTFDITPFNQPYRDPSPDSTVSDGMPRARVRADTSLAGRWPAIEFYRETR